MKTFIQTSANEPYSWPIDTLFLLGGGLILQLALHSYGLLLVWAGLLFHPWKCPSVIRIVLPVSDQVIVQGVLDQPLETLVSKWISSMCFPDEVMEMVRIQSQVKILKQDQWGTFSGWYKWDFAKVLVPACSFLCPI